MITKIDLASATLWVEGPLWVDGQNLKPPEPLPTALDDLSPDWSCFWDAKPVPDEMTLKFRSVLREVRDAVRRTFDGKIPIPVFYEENRLGYVFIAGMGYTSRHPGDVDEFMDSYTLYVRPVSIGIDMGAQEGPDDGRK